MSKQPPHDFVGRWQREALTEGFWTIVLKNPSTAFGGPPPRQMPGRMICYLTLGPPNGSGGGGRRSRRGSWAW